MEQTKLLKMNLNSKIKTNINYNNDMYNVSEITELLNKNSKKAYNILIECIEAKEQWAIELFFQKFMPRNDVLHIQVDQNNPDKTQATIDAILKAFSETRELTIDETCKQLQILSNLKLLKELNTAKDLKTRNEKQTED